MAVVSSKYQSNSGGVYKIRLEAAKIAITGNTVPTTALSDTHVEVQVSAAGSRRKYGIHPRGVYGSRVGTGADLNKVFRVFVPLLSPSNTATLLSAGSFTYKGNTYGNLLEIAET